MNSEVAAVILAGGFGTRIKHILKDVPKPMALVEGRPFVEWVIRFFRAQGIRRFVLSTGYKAEIVEQYFEKQPVPGSQILCIREDRPLGTAGGFLNGVERSEWTSPLWLVANGDSLAITALDKFIHRGSSVGIDASLIGLSVTDTARFGALQVSPDGNLVGFVEKQPGFGLINAGVYLFKATTLKQFPCTRPLSFEMEVFPSFLERSTRVAVESVSAPFLDIGTPASLEQAGNFIKANHEYFQSPR
jgi:D-glycero-alpha-D-manno-heptose 1-phosphate guanylyltransferase